MAIEIRRVSSDDELQAVYRQRFAVYVSELGYRQTCADPHTGTVVEPWDANGHILGAFDGVHLVASVRANYASCLASDGGFGDYVLHYGMGRFGAWFPHGIGIATKLIIDPPYRAGTLLARLALALYVHTREHMPHTMFCLIDCVPSLRDIYGRLGYRQIAAPFLHPAAGCVIPMAMAIYDQAHLMDVRSPLARVCPHHDRESAAWLARVVASAAATLASHHAEPLVSDRML